MISSRLSRLPSLRGRCFTNRMVLRGRILKCSVQPDGGSSQPFSTGAVVRTSTSEIRWGSFVSQLPVLELAAKEAFQEIMSSIGEDSKPELAIVFASSALGEEFDQVVPLLRELVPSLKSIVGCSGYGVIGGGPEGPVEVEGEPGFSLTLGQLPGVELHVLHTLRSGIPEPAASRQEWSDFVGVPYDTQKEVNFMIFSDPRFSQVDQVVEGLDYAFPESHKIGGVLSTTTRPRARALFAWSAKNDSRPTRVSGGGRKSSSARRPGAKGRNAAPTGKQSTADQEAPLESALSEVISTASSAAKSAPGEKTGNIFGSIFKMLSGGVKSGASDKADKSQPSPRGGFSSVKSIQGSSAGQPSFPSSSSGSSSSMSSVSNGMYLVGAVVLVMHGDVVMDTVTSMGFRAASNRIYRVESMARFNEIVTVTPEIIEGMIPPNQRGSSSGAQPSSRFITIRVGDSDDDSDDDDNTAGSEVLAVTAIVDMLESLDNMESINNLDEMLDSAMLAVAQDSGKPSAELTASDFEMIPLEGIDEDSGMLVASGRLRKGDRFKLMIRDNQGIKEDLREHVLSYKRKDLQAMLTGSESRPTFGVVMFTDMDRGESLYGERNFESRTLSTYVPAPTSGLFGGGQIAPFNEGHRVMENVCVAGILRAATPRLPKAS